LVFVKVLVQERKQVAAGDRRGGSVLRPSVECIDLLKLNPGKGVREGRLIKVKGAEERRETGAHRRRRNWPETPADMRGYGEGFRRPRCGSSGEVKGERERMPGAIYSLS
jgi:hypothetical protein